MPAGHGGGHGGGHHAGGRGGRGGGPGRPGGLGGGPAHHWGMGWLPWGGAPPGPPGERMCFLCTIFWCCCAPPPPPPVVVYEEHTYNAVPTGGGSGAVPATPVAAQSYQQQSYQQQQQMDPTPTQNYREIRACEYRDGDNPVRYQLTIPNDANPGQTIRVNLGGREFSVIVPDYVKRGETVLVLAPGVVSYGDA